MRVIVINAYFGRMPPYFVNFLASCAKNSRVEFLFFGDFTPPQGMPANVQFVTTTFKELAARFQSNFNFPIALRSPYKLCDFRPAFGKIFAPELKGCDWWGHCDFDMVFGDLTPVLDVARSTKYVKIFRRGHFTLYKNDPVVNAAYELPGGVRDYRAAFSTDDSVAFDETNGIDVIFRENNLSVCRAEMIADISPRSPFLYITRHPNRWGQLFVWRDGRLFCDAGDGLQREYVYIHLQKRRFSRSPVRLPGDQSPFVISQFGLFDLSREGDYRWLSLLSHLPNVAHSYRYYAQAVRKKLATLLGSSRLMSARNPGGRPGE
ncbi:MAG TPA: DUF6625 family protein [Polyangia bacterium]|nr:DUF6625 family protein [Polyangia bacterium]